MLKTRSKSSVGMNATNCINNEIGLAIAQSITSTATMGALDANNNNNNSSMKQHQQNCNQSNNQNTNNNNRNSNSNKNSDQTNSANSTKKANYSAAGFIAQPFANFHLKYSPFSAQQNQIHAAKDTAYANSDNMNNSNLQSICVDQKRSPVPTSALNTLGDSNQQQHYEAMNTTQPASNSINFMNNGNNHQQEQQQQQQQQQIRLNNKLKPANSFHSKAKKLLNLSTPTPLRPSSSTSCLFSSLTSEDSNESTSSLASMPTRASLTHEWKKLKTPNKCRECNLLVYFNGRECSFCGFVAHKKCATILVIKCSGQKVTSALKDQSSSTPAATSTSSGLSWSRKKSEKNKNNANQNNDSSNNNQDKHSSWPNKSQSQSQCSLTATSSQKSNNISNNKNSSNNCSSPTGSAASTSPIASNYKQPNSHHHQPIYGQPIMFDSHQIVEFIRRFVYEIDSRGLTSKGIYRVSSIKSKVDKLCNYYDQNLSSLVDLSSFHPNIIANAFKMYLRQLPEPLLTDNLYCRFINIAKKYPLDKTCSAAPGQATSSSNQQLSRSRVDLINNDHDDEYMNQRRSSKLYSPPTSMTQLTSNLKLASTPAVLTAGNHHQRGTSISMTNLNDTSVFSPAYDPMLIVELRETIELLPPINKELIAIIMRHLKRVADMSDSNQMSAKNLSIIFGPTLLNTRDKSIAIVDSIHQARVVELMILWAEQIFPLYSNYESNAVIELDMPQKKSDTNYDEDARKNLQQHQPRSARYSCSFDDTYQNNVINPFNDHDKDIERPFGRKSEQTDCANLDINTKTNSMIDCNNDKLTEMIIYVDVPKVDITLCDEDEPNTTCDQLNGT